LPRLLLSARVTDRVKRRVCGGDRKKSQMSQGSAIVRVVVVVVGLLAASGCRASSGASEEATDIPRTSWDRRPNLMGVWEGTPLSPEAYGLAELSKLYHPAVNKTMTALTEKDDPVHGCIPYGSPRHQALGLPMEIVQSPGGIAILSDRPHVFRYIPTDGRPHLEDIFPTNLGNPVGRWEGDTLVIDVTSFIGRIWLAGGSQTLPGGPAGWPTSESMHLVERFRLLNAKTLEYQATIEDTGVLTGPWQTPRIIYRRSAADQIGEGICIPPGFDFEPPAARRSE
jgi:hypothetical protein